MIIYYSGTPGIRGGLPEELIEIADVMVSWYECGKVRKARRRLKRIVEQRNDHLLLWKGASSIRCGDFAEGGE